MTKDHASPVEIKQPKTVNNSKKEYDMQPKFSIQQHVVEGAALHKMREQLALQTIRIESHYSSRSLACKFAKSALEGVSALQLELSNALSKEYPSAPDEAARLYQPDHQQDCDVNSALALSRRFTQVENRDEAFFENPEVSRVTIEALSYLNAESVQKGLSIFLRSGSTLGSSGLDSFREEMELQELV